MYDQPLTVTHSCAINDTGTFTRRIVGPAGASGIIRDVIVTARDTAPTSGGIYISDQTNTDGAYVNNWETRPAANSQEQFPQTIGQGEVLQNREIEADTEIRVHSTLNQAHDVHVVIDWNALVPKPERAA